MGHNQSQQRAFFPSDWLTNWIGLFGAISIITIWLGSLYLLLPVNFSELNYFEVIVGVLGRTFCQTGLFIIGHDAMHQNLMPHYPRLNHSLGLVAVWLYGFLPYEHCLSNHQNHHAHLAQAQDPDFHHGGPGFISWYLKFIGNYLSVITLMIWVVNWSLIFWIATQTLDIFWLNLLVFWMIPFVLSSLQLFVFGTYLPHGDRFSGSYFVPRQTRSFFSVLISFLTCYHFGYYHWEHHQYPHTPWYQLPFCHVPSTTNAKKLDDIKQTTHL